MGENINYIYRFRSIYAILGGYKELKNQEIYFASPEELNDPLEGFKNIFFKGDEILWKNFFKQYIYCLTKPYMSKTAIGKHSKEDLELILEIYPEIYYEEFLNEEQSEDDIMSKLEWEKIKNIYEGATKKFLENDFIKTIIKQLSNKENVRQYEVLLYLTLVTPIANVAIDIALLEDNKRENKNKLDYTQYHKFDLHYLKKINELKLQEEVYSYKAIESINNINDKSKKDDFFSKINAELLRLESDKIKYHSKNSRLSKIEYFLEEFPQKYMKQIEHLINPKWYTACFMSGYDNSAIWGYYGDNHKGVCLEFKVKKENNEKILKLKSSSNKWLDYNFNKIDYSGDFGEFNFFYNIYNLNEDQVMSQWYSYNGEKSNYIDELLKNEKKFMKEYCENFKKTITTKIKEWHNENEYRCIMINNNDNNSRKFKYDFKDLNGIIFGMNTSLKDKIKIIKIIRKKCRENDRRDFNFYEMQYNRQANKIERKKLEIVI